LLQVIAFKSFTVADMVPASTGGTFAGNVAVNGNLTVDTNTLFVDAANNRVGVGTTGPATLLNASGATPTFRLTQTDGSGNIDIAHTGSAYSYGGVGANEGFIYTLDDLSLMADGAHNLKFHTNTAERARLDSSGNLLVGTTSQSFSNTQMTVFQDVAGGNAVEASFDGNGGVGFLGVYRGSSGIANYGYFMYNGVSVVGTITSTGSTTSYNTTSDYRLKEDVQPMVGASDRLMALKPVNFAWKVDGSRVDGFLAHEAQEVVPEAVTGSKDAVDDEGSPQYQGIDQSKIVPLLTAALQEALIKIEQLEARMAILEGGAA